MSDRACLLECCAVARAYQTSSGMVEALTPVSFVVPQGGTVAIIGPSGSGKSTLLGLLAGLDRPTAGDVLFQGRSHASMGQAHLIAHRRKNVGFLFQYSNLVAGLNVQDNVAIPLWLNGWRAADVGDRVRELLARLGLEELRLRLPSQLSGGEMQRVALCRAVAHRPPLVVADEPTGSLDRANADRVAELLADLNDKEGCAVVVATHNLALAERMDSIVDLTPRSPSGEAPAGERGAAERGAGERVAAEGRVTA
jgi:ABC-type lipoprotein export system ATPase subunit